MAVFHYPKLVRYDDLVLFIDPANPKCFKPGNNYCKNLVTGNYVTGANGSPGAGDHTPDPSNFPDYLDERSGIWDFGGVSGMNCEEDLGRHDEMSLHMWILKPDGRTGLYLADARNDGGQWFLSNYKSHNINYNGRIHFNFGGSYQTTHPEFIGNWHCLTITGDKSDSRLYWDGELLTVGNSINSNLGRNFRIGIRYTASDQWNGFMGPIMAFNRKLNDIDVRHLTVAHSARFQL